LCASEGARPGLLKDRRGGPALRGRRQVNQNWHS